MREWQRCHSLIFQKDGDGMGTYLIKGILIGLLFGMPVGAIGAMTVQRTLVYGFKAGLMTGLGSSVADCIYACIGAFGLTIISDFLLEYQMIIHILGGALVLIMGLRLIIRTGQTDSPQKPTTGGVKMFLSSFVIGITNPAAILTFLFAFSYFGITGKAGWVDGMLLVIGVFIGTYIWWGLLSTAVCLIKKKTVNHSFRYMNTIFGSILILFSAVVFIKTFLS